MDPYFFREFVYQLSDDLGKDPGPGRRRGGNLVRCAKLPTFCLKARKIILSFFLKQVTFSGKRRLLEEAEDDSNGGLRPGGGEDGVCLVRMGGGGGGKAAAAGDGGGKQQ